MSCDTATCAVSQPRPPSRLRLQAKRQREEERERTTHLFLIGGGIAMFLRLQRGPWERTFGKHCVKAPLATSTKHRIIRFLLDRTSDFWTSALGCWETVYRTFFIGLLHVLLYLNRKLMKTQWKDILNYIIDLSASSLSQQWLSDTLM